MSEKKAVKRRLVLQDVEPSSSSSSPRKSDTEKLHSKRSRRQLADAASLLPRVKVKDDGGAQFRAIVDQLAVLGDGSLRLQRSTIPDAGLGLFAARDFDTDEPITAYVGLPITHEEALRMRQKKKDTHVRSHIQLRWALDGLRLPPDGTPITNPHVQMQGKGVAAFANHSFDESKRNADFDFVDSAINVCRLQKFFDGVGSAADLDPNERVTFIRATKPIAAGTEILLNYGDDYWLATQESEDDDDDKGDD